jgi:hypothetical protein
MVLNKHDNIEVNTRENKAKREKTIRQRVFIIFFLTKTIAVQFALC